MKIFINTEGDSEELEISIRCNGLTPELERMIALLRTLDMQLTGKREGETHLVDAADVLYLDTADRKTFFYTKHAVYETGLHLYELEQQLSSRGFFRINKSCIVNGRHIVSLKAELDRKIRITMDNGEQLMISRQYAEGVKTRLGVK